MTSNTAPQSKETKEQMNFKQNTDQRLALKRHAIEKATKEYQ